MHTTTPYPSLWTALNTDWDYVRTSASSRSRMALWRRSYPALAPHHDLDAILDAIRQEPNPPMAALITAHQSGDTLAGRVLLQAMVGRLVRAARYARVGSDYRCFDDSADKFRERAQITVAAFMTVLATVPTNSKNLPASLYLRTLDAVTKEPPTPDIVPIPDTVYDGSSNLQVADPYTPEEASVDVDTVLVWATSNGSVTAEEVALIRRCYVSDGEDWKAIAADLDITYTALRKRASRALNRLREGVLQALVSGTFDTAGSDTVSLMAAA
ncbi:hypothetical protein ACTHRK_16855 [Dietzia cercidiphylli]|uniref:hypothetical protein n=1 Tax=Dietzia cercidiphylli TaxID=498199 RepID=UPI003F81F9A3